MRLGFDVKTALLIREHCEEIAELLELDADKQKLKEISDKRKRQKHIKILSDRAFYALHRVEILEKKKEYRKKNRLRLLEYASLYYAMHKKEFREYSKRNYEKNKSRIIQNSYRWKKENPEKVKASYKKYRENHAEKIKAYRDANREKLRAYNREYRRRKKALKPAHFLESKNSLQVTKKTFIPATVDFITVDSNVITV